MKLERDIKEMDIEEEALINEESLMDAEIGKDHHLGDHDTMDTLLEDRDMVAISLGMVAISLGIMAETRLGGDRILEEKTSLDVIDHELRTRLQNLRDVSDVDARLVSKSGR